MNGEIHNHIRKFIEDGGSVSNILQVLSEIVHSIVVNKTNYEIANPTEIDVADTYETDVYKNALLRINATRDLLLTVELNSNQKEEK